MVERQLPKLHTRVRFPSPAVLPIKTGSDAPSSSHESERKLRTNPLKSAQIRACLPTLAALSLGMPLAAILADFLSRSANPLWREDPKTSRRLAGPLCSLRFPLSSQLPPPAPDNADEQLSVDLQIHLHGHSTAHLT